MKANADVVYRDLDVSPALNSAIYKKLAKLNRYTDSIIRSRITLASPQKHKHKGKIFRASIDLGIKGMPVQVSQDGPSAHIAVRDAFEAAERKLKESSAKQRSH